MRGTGIALGICAVIASGSFIAHKAIVALSSTGCHFYELETQRSSNPLWIAERVAVDCWGSTRIELSLRRQDEKPQQQNFFLTVSENSDDVLFKWLDGSRLLIAFPEGTGAFEKPDRFRGIQLDYSAYPNDPELFRIASASSILRRQVAFDFRFDILRDFAGIPNVRCNVTLSAEDGQYFKGISLRLTALKHFKQQTRSGSEIRTLAERSYASISVYSDNDYTLPSGFFTSASFDSLLPAKTVSRVAHFKPVAVPSGRNAAGRTILWNIEQSEVVSALNKLRSGHFNIKLGFWLDSTEIIYTNTSSGNLGVVQDFEKCMAENSVFEDKS